AHCLSWPLWIVGFAAAIDAGIDAVLGELLFDAFVEVMPRRCVDERPIRFSCPVLEPSRQLLNGDLGFTNPNVDAGCVCDRQRGALLSFCQGSGLSTANRKPRTILCIVSRASAELSAAIA